MPLWKILDLIENQDNHKSRNILLFQNIMLFEGSHNIIQTHLSWIRNCLVLVWITAWWWSAIIVWVWGGCVSEINQPPPELQQFYSYQPSASQVKETALEAALLSPRRRSKQDLKQLQHAWYSSTLPHYDYDIKTLHLHSQYTFHYKLPHLFSSNILSFNIQSWDLWSLICLSFYQREKVRLLMNPTWLDNIVQTRQNTLVIIIQTLWNCIRAESTQRFINSVCFLKR